MKTLIVGPNASVNAWRERGYDDAYHQRNGGKARTPLNAGDAEREAYLQGYRSGKKARENA